MINPKTGQDDTADTKQLDLVSLGTLPDCTSRKGELVLTNSSRPPHVAELPLFPFKKSPVDKQTTECIVKISLVRQNIREGVWKEFGENGEALLLRRQHQGKIGLATSWYSYRYNDVIQRCFSLQSHKKRVNKPQVISDLSILCSKMPLSRSSHLMSVRSVHAR